MTLRYGSADAFLVDHAANLTEPTPSIACSHAVVPGTIVEVGLSIGGLADPVLVDALVKTVDGERCTIAWLAGGREKLGSVAHWLEERPSTVGQQLVEVLIVEDNPHVCRLVQEGLSGPARRELPEVLFTFDVANNGADGIELLEQRTFDLAIVDVYLPVLDGAALIRKARASLRHQLPILTVSAGGEVAREIAMQAGASAFLDKPVRLRQMMSTMRQLLAM